MSINFPQVEEEVLAFWKKVDAFQTQLRLTESGERYNFYDGPPFATGKFLFHPCQPSILPVSSGQVRAVCSDYIYRENMFPVQDTRYVRTGG